MCLQWLELTQVHHKERTLGLPQEDEAVPSTCAAPVRGESGDLESPGSLADTKTSRWDLSESISMPEPLHSRRPSINHMMSLSLRRLEVSRAGGSLSALPPAYPPDMVPTAAC